MNHAIDPVDLFISRLYRSTQQISLANFRHWALQGLQSLIDFDSAIWSTGHLSTRTFHTHTLLGLPDSYPQDLLKNLPHNPISSPLFNSPGRPVDMSDVVDDDVFYSSRIYQQFFRRYGIERILSSVHIDGRSGIYTLLTLYRNKRDRGFDNSDKALYQRTLFHLLSAASHAGVAQLKSPMEHRVEHFAICDKHGVYHEAEPSFLDLVEESFPGHTRQLLPFPVPIFGEKQLAGPLIVSATPLGDLSRVTIREANALDQLTTRERDVVEGVTQGLSFKQIARELSLSPSTVSNHLYRVYQKLKISNRSELAELIKER